VQEHSNVKPITHQRDLAKLPRALMRLVERPQWCVWKWTRQPNGRWQKPPFQALDPRHHASPKHPDTWADYATALATVQAGNADGISYVLTTADPFAAIDLDHCRDPDTHSIGTWAQNFLDVARHSYSEVTPSGEGCRIWGLTGPDTDPVNRKFTLEIDGKPIAAELFRRTSKVLTVTGYRLDTIRELTSLDRAFDWAVTWGERRKAAAAEAAATQLNGHGFNGSGPGHGIDHIERIVREGAAAGANRSDSFHMVVGHYLGCGWSVEQIDEHLRQFPDGIAGRYLGEGRLSREISRSAGKYNNRALPLLDGWKAPEISVETPEMPSREVDAPELEPISPDTPSPNPDDDEDVEDDVDELEGKPQQDPKLPPLYAHGDTDPWPLKAWLIKNLIPTVGHGLLSGQSGAGKTFVVFDLAAPLWTGQPFLGRPVKRQCGVLLIAAEGASEVRLRLDAVVRNKCGNMERAPFRWYESTPMLLQKGAVETLIAMARQADHSLQQEFGLPLGLIVIDTVAACAGYARAGDESDPAAAQAVMNVLKALAQALGCFVLGVDHFGKNVEAGTRGASSKEAASDLVLACLGDKSLSGSVSNTRLAVRKNRGGQQGQEYPFILRVVEVPELDDDGEPITSMVVDWQPSSPGGNQARPGPDPWAQSRRQDQRAAVLRLKRLMMSAMAEHGVEREIPPDGPAARMISQGVVRGLFYAQTPADGTPKQKADFRRQQFNRALDWAESQELIASLEIDDVVYLRLCSHKAEDDNEGG
jgi:AAA domain